MMGFSHSARSSTDKAYLAVDPQLAEPVALHRDRLRTDRGREEVKPPPFLLLIAPRARKAYPRKVNEVRS